MATLTNNPIFGIMLTVWAYYIGIRIFRKYPSPATTPLLLATILLIAFLKLTHISYKDYYNGGSFLTMLITPSTVVLAIPLYRTFHLMKHHIKSISISIILASVINTVFTAIVAKFFGMKYFLVISLFPKSVTTAMAVGITSKAGGLATITLVVVVITGILTSVLGPIFLKLLRAIGLALGGTGHAIGTGQALKYGQVQGAMAGLAIGITGICYVIVSPLVAGLILK
ncbi:TPA: LrgB family protein [Streptococcus agalactiae]|nr:LrgB family protein [Streptococcus agalactiae]HEM9432504.1 LrgB family protein [Streptococcus agalactiae]HEM9434584.1 LrgB family protein [Streptococcus agalactiae]HEM9444759.1 LrgB family protein [Streptococcus agalactiae]HEM9468913.1 LrgB family protein [Streptococcus agalactiae]